MYIITTRKLTVILSLALLIWGGAVRAQSEEQIKRFNEDREKYFNENLDLNDAEKKAFWPLYNDFTNRKIKLMEEELNTFRYSQQNSENLSETEIIEILVRIRDLKEDVFMLKQEYYKEKFPSVLPPKKVLKLYKVEWDFRKHLVGKIRGEGHGQGGRNGKERGDQNPGMSPMPPMYPSPGF